MWAKVASATSFKCGNLYGCIFIKSYLFSDVIKPGVLLTVDSPGISY